MSAREKILLAFPSMEEDKPTRRRYGRELARVAALSRWSKAGPDERAANARRGQDGLTRRFSREIAEEHPGLSAEQMAGMVDARRRLHFAEMRLKAARSGRSGRPRKVRRDESGPDAAA